MSLLAPALLALGVAGAAAVALLHLLTRRRPRASVLPTARFLPDAPVNALARARRPADLLLLALRALALLLASLAAAGPVLTPRRVGHTRVVALDLSRAVRDPDSARARAGASLRPGDALIVFDSAARVLRGTPSDSLARLARSDAPGSLSAALVAAVREGEARRARADTVELVLVSPLAEEEWDAAALRVRALFPGPVRVDRVASPEAPRASSGIELRGAAPADPLRATVALVGGARAGAAARIVRGVPTAEDSSWARDSARVLVLWPAGADGVAHDSSAAVVAGSTVVVAPFARMAGPPPGVAAARWADGAPAATERALGAGCVRDVAIPLPVAGDLALRESVQELVATMARPCGVPPRLAPLPDSLVAGLSDAPRGGASRAGAARAAAAAAPPFPAAWLLGAALLLLVAEWAARRRAEGA